jgi:hypothetical protein
MTESQTVTKDPICGTAVGPATALQANAKERGSTSAVTRAGRSFCPSPPVLSRHANLAAAVDKICGTPGPAREVPVKETHAVHSTY